MNCPKCGKALKTVSFAGTEVEKCSSCGGLWFDALEDRDLRQTKGAAERLDTGDAAKGRKQDAQGKVDCPRCKARMIRMVDREQAHIWYENCPVCHGSFFDAGEFRD